MASEAEYERLYQQFVENGGVDYTFDAANKTPAEYWDLEENSELTAEERAALEAAERQYNYSQALNEIAAELESGTEFTNPLTSVINDGLNSYNGWELNPSVISLNDFATTVDTASVALSSNPLKKKELDDFMDSINRVVGIGAGIYSVLAIAPSAVQMFNSLKTHTDTQVAGMPDSIEEVSKVAGMNAQFSPSQSGPCNIFHNLMGFLSGVYDGALEFVAGLKNKMENLINSAVQSAIAQAKGVIENFAAGTTTGSLLNNIKATLGGLYDKFQSAMKSVSSLISSAMNAVDTLKKAIQAEIAGLANGLASLTNKIKALSIAALSMDPCKVDVLMRTGSETLQGSISKLNPTVPGVPDIVGTELDPRANPTEVSDKLASAEKLAGSLPGVPQSPSRSNATKYQPSSSYLHSVKSKLGGPVDTEYTSVPTTSSTTGETSSTPTRNTESIVNNAPEAPDGKGWLVESYAFVEYQEEYLSSKEGYFSRRGLVKSTAGLMELVEDNDEVYDADVRKRAKEYRLEGEALYKELTEQMQKNRDDLTYRSFFKDRLAPSEQRCKDIYDSSIKKIAERQLARAYKYFDEANTWYEQLPGW